MTKTQISTTNKLATVLLVTAVCVIMGITLAVLAGCSTQSSGQKYATAVDIYSAQTTAMVTASRTGLIGVEDYRLWDDQIRKPASELLDAWAAALINGTEFKPIDRLNQLLDQMVIEGLKAKKQKEQANASEHLGGHRHRTGGDQGWIGHLRRHSTSNVRRAGSHRRRVQCHSHQENQRRRSRRERTPAAG